MDEYILQTFGLTKQYGKIKAVQNINMKIKKGDIYGFIGKNGAGKTTLIRMITGLVTPTKGEIQLFSEKSEKTESISLSRIGSIIEHPALYPEYTAYENLELRSKLLGICEKDSINKVLQFVDLTDVDKKKVKNFSLGMKQRLGLALALLGNPDFLILDEPTNGLDPDGIVQMRKLLKRLNGEYGITILISSHILGELSKLATRYGIINNGILVDEFTSIELEERCKRYLRLEVDDAVRSSLILENALKTTDYEVLPKNIIKVYDLLDKSGEICLELAKNSVKIYSIESNGEDLEGYFMSLMGGSDHA
ncbi:bacitracin ABC transporter ATP-binding protein [Sporosarcina globispora]|uniref:Bacitracin ABC transporter ATP-binding protein n=1 Tax=Sporosarcina globispora TaxID=1459 RepID=A0A0M0GEY5_SPOGL|nr:bacitracin ABC transporter ATP-binding protein [Sporosarcina globispora]